MALLVIFVMCSLKLSLLSKVRPRNLAEVDSPIVVLPTTIGLRDHFLFQVNITILVFRALIERSLVWSFGHFLQLIS